MYFYNGPYLKMSDLVYARQLGRDLSRLGEGVEGRVVMHIELQIKDEDEQTGENVSCSD